MKATEVSVLGCVICLCLSFCLGLISPLAISHFKNQTQVTALQVVQPEQIVTPVNIKNKVSI